jgi:tRNA threonylcarbamoyladenosine modification (KEOPS) complex  Pcc1 subunit
MNYTAVIRVPDARASTLFTKDFSSERVLVEKKDVKEGFEFHIDAKDSVALRAVCNSLTKLLTVYEKMETL